MLGLAITATLGNGPRVVPIEQRRPLWLIPNLLSLDAPLVAVAWLYMFAKTWRADYLPWAAYISLGLVVWIIYAADRLIDSGLQKDSVNLEARHEFHRRHRRFFKIALTVGSIAALVLVVLSLPVSIYGYSIIGGVLVIAFFALSVFGSQEPNELPYAKNIIAGFAFAYGTSMIAFVYTGFETMEWLKSRELICFSVLCILNISAIDLWEQAARSADLELKATNELSLTLPLLLLAGFSLVFATQDRELSTRAFFYAILTGAGLLYILNRIRQRFSSEVVRVFADVALLLPFLVFLASRRH